MKRSSKVSSSRPIDHRAFLFAIAVALGSAAPLGWLQARPRDGQNVAAVFAPWLGTERAFGLVASAGGEIVRTGFIGTILVAHSDSPGFAERLRSAGAWMVVDPLALGGCLAPST